jgi:hypothetical protein
MDIQELIKRLDSLILESLKQKADFEKVGMDVSASCSSAMAHAYENVRSLILNETNT